MGNGELREPTFLVMTALASGPAHGYALLQEVGRMADGDVKLRPGTLYAVLDRLVAEGWAEVSGEEVVGGRLRRYYRLTDRGARRLSEEAARWRANAVIAEQRLRGWEAAIQP